MRCLVTGSQGMLGHYIKRVFKDDDMIYTDKDTLDVADYDSVLNILTIMTGEVDYILHLAAETDLEYCQKNPSAAYYTNTAGTMNMVRLAEILKVPIVYISTAGVFMGEKNWYDEADKPEPINHYGRSKWYGELAIKAYARHYIFRISWAMGGGPALDKKFVNKIIALARGGREEIHAISDVYGSPTYHYDVAKTIRSFLEQKAAYGLYHVAGIGKASRYDVAEAIVDTLKLPIEVIPAASSMFHDKFPCPRPRGEVLVSRHKIATCMRPWREALKEYLEESYA